MTNTSSVNSDDTFIAGIGAMDPADRINALLDVALDTAEWQPVDAHADTDGAAR